MLLINGEQLDMVTYPNNERLLRPQKLIPPVTRERQRLVTTLKWDGDEDFLRLWILSQWMCDNLSARDYHLVLEIPYMPYSRADRSEEGSVFSLKYICELLCDMAWSEIVVYEPHSDVTEELLVRCTTKYTTITLMPEVMKTLNWDMSRDYLVLPDKGAADRYDQQSNIFEKANVLIAEKTRDFDTGKIVDITFPKRVQAPEGARALIIDDLCSRGGTFIGVANQLREMGFKEVHLAVTHFEHAGFNKDLFGAMTSIHATDSITPPAPFQRFTVHPLKELHPDYV